MANKKPLVLYDGDIKQLQSGDTLEGGTGSSELYTNEIPVPTTLGGVTAGTTFTDVPVVDVLDMLLYPYQTPAFTSFGFTQTSPIEVGTILAAGTKTFTWATSNPTNVTVNSINIQDVTGGASLITGTANDGSEALPIAEATRSTEGAYTWRISATNTKAQTFTRDFSVNWQFKIYYGESTNGALDAAGILGLRVNTLKASSGVNGTYAFSTGGYKYFCYPSSFGTKVNFKDTSTNLDVAMNPVTTVSVTNALGVTATYNVHRTLNQLGGSINIAIS